MFIWGPIFRIFLDSHTLEAALAHSSWPPFTHVFLRFGSRVGPGPFVKGGGWAPLPCLSHREGEFRPWHFPNLPPLSTKNAPWPQSLNNIRLRRHEVPRPRTRGSSGREIKVGSMPALNTNLASPIRCDPGHWQYTCGACIWGVWKMRRYYYVAAQMAEIGNLFWRIAP